MSGTQPSPAPMMGAPMPPPGMTPGQPPQLPQPPPLRPNPAFLAWQMQMQQVQAITAANAQLQQQFDAAVKAIKKDEMRGFRLDIEADSTIAPDEQAEKAARTDFLREMIPMLMQVVPIAQGNPPLASLAKELTLFAVRGFRVARPLEEAFEKAFDAIAKMPPNPKVSGEGSKPGAPGPNPQLELAKTQADIHDTDTKAETERAGLALKQQQMAVETEIEREKMASEAMRAQAELAGEAQERQQRGTLEQARMLTMASRTAGRLV
jgi:hypothetical protein